MLCMLAGTALSSYASWMKLFPFKFMELTCVAVRGFTCNLFDQAFFLWKLLPLVWIPCSFLLCYATLRIYRSRSYHRILEAIKHEKDMLSMKEDARLSCSWNKLK